MRLARPPLPLQLQLNITHSQIFHTNKYIHKVYSTRASTRKQKQVEPLHTIHTQTSAHKHTHTEEVYFRQVEVTHRGLL